MLHDPHPRRERTAPPGSSAPPGQARWQALEGPVLVRSSRPKPATGGRVAPAPVSGAARPNSASSVANTLGPRVPAGVVPRGAKALVGFSRVSPGAPRFSRFMALKRGMCRMHLAGPAGLDPEEQTNACRGNGGKPMPQNTRVKRAGGCLIRGRAACAAGPPPAFPKPPPPRRSSGFMASDRGIRVAPSVARARSARRAATTRPRATRAARFAARANAIACRQGAWPAASASASRRSTSRTRSARRAALSAHPAAAARPVVPPPFLTTGSSARWQVLHGIASAVFENATWDGWSGAFSSAGPSASRAAISAGKCSRSRSAAPNSRIRVASVLTYRCIARFAAVAPPCFVCAAIDRAFPSGVRGPVHFPQCVLHRPFAIAGARHGLPERARAPQRGARFGFPRGLPFRSGPLPPPGRAAGGSAGPAGVGLSHAITPPPPRPVPLSPRACSHHRVVARWQALS